MPGGVVVVGGGAEVCGPRRRPGIVIGWAVGADAGVAVGGGAQKLTFRPLPIKPHEFFIGKG